MKRFLSAAILCVLASASYGDDADISKLVPANDSSGAFSETRTHWTIRSSSTSFTLDNGVTQKVLSRRVDGSVTVLALQTGDLSTPVSLSPSEQSSYLAQTRFVHPANDAVKALAAKAMQSSDPVDSASRLVYDYIGRKSMMMPLATDLQVIALREGDCKSHTVLLVSVLRAAGIPARAVTGVVLMPSFAGDKNIFGFHMWAEAYRNGRWVLADATFAGGKQCNRYIALAPHSLKTASPLDYLSAIDSIQKLSISRNRP